MPPCGPHMNSAPRVARAGRLISDVAKAPQPPQLRKGFIGMVVVDADKQDRSRVELRDGWPGVRWTQSFPESRERLAGAGRTVELSRADGRVQPGAGSLPAERPVRYLGALPTITHRSHRAVAHLLSHERTWIPHLLGRELRPGEHPCDREIPGPVTRPIRGGRAGTRTPQVRAADPPPVRRPPRQNQR
jgi:hypothetical protein